MARRRSKGTGSITKLGRSKYLARYQAPSGERPSEVFETVRDAEAWLAKSTGSIRDGTWVSDEKTKLSDWIDEYIETYRPHVAYATQESYKGSINRLWKYCPGLMDTPLCDISTPQIQRSANTLHKHYHSATVKKTLSLVGQSLKRAAKLRMIAVNPVDDITIQESRESHGGAEIKQDDLELLQLHCSAPSKDWRSQVYKDIIGLIMATGMRTEEARGLTANDISTTGVYINRALNSIGGEEPPKTRLSKRHIPLPPELHQMINQRAKISISGYLFESARGQPLNHRNILRHFKDVLPNHALHDLRHTWISRAIRNGANIKAISTLTGDSIQTLLKTYTHVTEDDLETAMSKAVHKPMISQYDDIPAES